MQPPSGRAGAGTVALLRDELRTSRAVALAEGILVGGLGLGLEPPARLLRENGADRPDGLERAAVTVLAWWALQDEPR